MYVCVFSLRVFESSLHSFQRESTCLCISRWLSCCIIIPLITLTCSRVTAQHKQTRPLSGILLWPLLYFSLSLLYPFCHISGHFFLSSLSSTLFLMFSLCHCRPSPWLLSLSPGFSLACVLRTSSLAITLFTLCFLSLSALSSSLNLSVKKCHAVLTPFDCLFQNTMNFR